MEVAVHSNLTVIAVVALSVRGGGLLIDVLTLAVNESATRAKQPRRNKDA